MANEFSTSSSLTLGAENKDLPQLAPPPKVESVVTGKTSTKTRASKKLRNSIFAQDFRDVKEGVVTDIIRPRIKEIIYDIFKGFLNSADSTLQMMIWGEERRNPNNRVGDRVSYNQFSKRTTTTVSSPSMTSAFNCDDIIFESRGDAEVVLQSMYEYLDMYKCVTVANMYEFADQKSPWTANNYGWTNLSGATISRCFDGGYVINLPRATPLQR